MTGSILECIGCIYCQIVDIEVDIMRYGSSSQYYEKYKDLMSDPIQNALLQQSEEFFKNNSYTYYGIYGAFIATQVKKTKIPQSASFIITQSDFYR